MEKFKCEVQKKSSTVMEKNERLLEMKTHTVSVLGWQSAVWAFSSISGKKRRILNFALIFKEQLHIKLHMVEKNFYDYCATDQNWTHLPHDSRWTYFMVNLTQLIQYIWTANYHQSFKLEAICVPVLFLLRYFENELG